MKKILCIFTGSASGARFLIEKDPNYGKSYIFTGAVVNKKNTRGEQLFKDNFIPCYEVNTRNFLDAHDFTGKVKDMNKHLRKIYFASLLTQIAHIEFDLILLSGFMLAIAPPLLGYRPIINVHPADLSILGENGKPKYIGDQAVRDALRDGMKTTASTIHVVETELDCGEIICISDHIEVAEGISPEDHQEKMKVLCDGPALQKALELICTRAFKFKKLANV